MDAWTHGETADTDKWNRMNIVKGTYSFLKSLPNHLRVKGLVAYDTESDELLVNYGTESAPSFRSPFVPVGTIEVYAGEISSIPGGWRVCHGQSLDATEYDELFKAIGTAYSTDNTFKLPDLRDRFAKSYEPAPIYGGENEVRLTENELPSHRHVQVNQRDEASDFRLAYLFVEHGDTYETTSETDTTTSSIGGSQAHENKPPFIKLHYIIKVR